MSGAILIMNGPGLPRLTAVTQIEEACRELCTELGLGLDFRQAHDHETMNRWVQEDSKDFAAIIINPAGCPASSLDPVGAHGKPVIEVHLENIFKFDGEGHPYIEGPANEVGFICGLGQRGYTLAIRSLARRLEGRTASQDTAPERL